MRDDAQSVAMARHGMLAEVLHQAACPGDVFGEAAATVDNLDTFYQEQRSLLSTCEVSAAGSVAISSAPGSISTVSVAALDPLAESFNTFELI